VRLVALAVNAPASIIIAIIILILITLISKLSTLN
jgi:hypothetical protein